MIISFAVHWWYLPIVLFIASAVLYWLAWSARAWDDFTYAALALFVFCIAVAVTIGHFL